MTTSISPATEQTIHCQDWQTFMDDQAKGSVDLILTDPPYAISRKTGFSKFKTGVPRFAVSMDFGKWDHKEIDLENFTKACYRVLRTGGTAIIWYDVWKITDVEKAMQEAGFKMIRLIIWQKTNPVPLNQSASYLSNTREVAVVGVKGGTPTFNGRYDNGLYHTPIPRHGGKKLHPTQKPVDLFAQLVIKHSNVGDLVIDPFVGSGTTGVAAVQDKRLFKGCDIDKTYVKVANQRILTTKVRTKGLMYNKEKTHSELFLELANPDKEGFSKPIKIDRFIGPYEVLRLGNGGSWCRDNRALAKKFNVIRNKKGNKIISIELHGYKKITIDKSVPAHIKRTISKKQCAVLAINKVEVDLKDGHKDDPRLSDINKVREDDFQPLSTHAHYAKREHCKECRTSKKRFDAKRLGYSHGHVRGGEVYEGTCVGCYWHDPYFFNQEFPKLLDK